MQASTCTPVLPKTKPLTKSKTHSGYRDAFGVWLDSRPWNYFVTCTTHYEMSEKAARRAMKRFFSKISEHFPSAELFWVSEPNDRRHGCHTHALLYTGGIPNSSTTVELIWEAWHIVSGAKSRKSKQSNFTTVKDYVINLGAHHYVAKYIERPNADWDIELGAELNDSYVQDTSFNRKRVYRPHLI